MNFLNKAKSQVSNRIEKGRENRKELANLGCTAEQVRENSKAIAHIGDHLMKIFPEKDGGVFSKKVKGFKSMAEVVNCDAFYQAKREKSKLGGKRRRKSRRKRRKSKKRKSRKSRRKRKKSRRRRRR